MSGRGELFQLQSFLKLLLLSYIFGSFLAVVPQLDALRQLNFFLEIVRSFPQFVVPGLLLAAALGIALCKNGQLLRGTSLAAAGIGSLCVFCTPLLPFYSGARNAMAALPGTPFSLFIANVEFGSADTAGFLTQLQQQNPDLVFMSEPTQHWIDAVNLRKDYPYSVEFPGKSVEGAALYSKFPLTDTGPARTVPGFAGVYTTVTIGTQQIRFLGIHAPPPTADETLKVREKFFQALAAEVERDRSLPLIVAGDFNTSPTATHYQMLIEKTRLRNAAEGLGLRFTWFVKPLPFFRAFIDYALISETLTAEKFDVLEPFGSDHLPVNIRFRLSER